MRLYYLDWGAPERAQGKLFWRTKFNPCPRQSMNELLNSRGPLRSVLLSNSRRLCFIDKRDEAQVVEAMWNFLTTSQGEKRRAPVRFINPAMLEQNPRYTQVVEINGGRLLLISGQAATDKDGKVIGKGDFRRQAEQVFANIKSAVEAAGGTIDDIVKLNSYIVDPGTNLSAYREVRVKFFGKNKNQPASTTVGVSSLVNPDLLLEIEALAVLPNNSR